MWLREYFNKTRVEFTNSEKNAEWFAKECARWTNEEGDCDQECSYDLDDNVITWDVTEDWLENFCLDLAEKYPDEHFVVKGRIDRSSDWGTYWDYNIKVGDGIVNRKETEPYYVFWFHEITRRNHGVKEWCERRDVNYSDELNEKYWRYVFSWEHYADIDELKEKFIEKCELADSVTEDFLCDFYMNLKIERDEYVTNKPEVKEKLKELYDLSDELNQKKKEKDQDDDDKDEVENDELDALSKKISEIATELVQRYPEMDELFFADDTCFFVDESVGDPYFDRKMDTGFDFDPWIIRFDDLYGL